MKTIMIDHKCDKDENKLFLLPEKPKWRGLTNTYRQESENMKRETSLLRRLNDRFLQVELLISNSRSARSQRPL